LILVVSLYRFVFTHFLRAFSFAAALATLGAKGSDSSNAISDDLPFIGFFCLPPFIVNVDLNRVLLPSFFFAAALAALGAEGSDSSNAISDDLPCIGFLSTSICFYVSLYRFLLSRLLCTLFFAAALAALGAQGSDNSNAISGFFFYSGACYFFFVLFLVTLFSDSLISG